jgi:hypothetical protein
MTLPALDRTVLVGSCAQLAQLRPCVPKTGQTGQTGQLVENRREFDPSPGQKPTNRHAGLASACQSPASGTVQQRNPGARDVSSPILSAQARPSDGAPQP